MNKERWAHSLIHFKGYRLVAEEVFEYIYNSDAIKISLILYLEKGCMNEPPLVLCFIFVYSIHGSISQHSAIGLAIALNSRRPTSRHRSRRI